MVDTGTATSGLAVEMMRVFWSIVWRFFLAGVWVLIGCLNFDCIVCGMEWNAGSGNHCVWNGLHVRP